MSDAISRRLTELRDQYVRALPVRLDAARGQWQRLVQGGFTDEARLALVHTLHGLSGSGGSFGCESLSTAARQLEALMAAMTPEQWAGEGLREAERQLAVVEQAIRDCGSQPTAAQDTPP